MLLDLDPLSHVLKHCDELITDLELGPLLKLLNRLDLVSQYGLFDPTHHNHILQE